jgi:DNA-binding MarR family transcriptional regulator
MNMVKHIKPSRLQSDASTVNAVKQIANALEPFRALRATMPLQYVYTFLLIAMDEGKSVSEYAAMAGISKSVMSRHILDIGNRDRYMGEGFGLVETRPHPFELRKYEVFLSNKGRALLHRMTRTLGVVNDTTEAVTQQAQQIQHKGVN